jgi:uncharacterized caspase-like protein
MIGTGDIVRDRAANLRAACIFVAAAFLAALLFAATGKAEAARKAFVVGNSNYAHVASLPNPANDAADLAAKLKALDYEVTLELDVGRTQLLRSFQKFSGSLTADDLALVYFAGHGMQIGGENYLFPVDARVEKEDDAKQSLVALNALLADLSRITRTRILILDACRNNPFADEIAKLQATRSAGIARGLARVYAGVGSFIIYSTQPGNVALDGTGRNSPFTDALLRHISAPNADVHAVMRRVRGDVQRATAEQQVPWENSSLVDEVVFAGGNVVAALPSQPTQPTPAPATQLRSRVSPASTETYSYVTGLDPKGDNFLALRSGSEPDAVRIATMGPNTLLKVAESRGVWRRVVLLDGATGWAHSNWIACCRTIAGTPSGGTSSTGTAGAGKIAPPPAAKAPGETCESLWLRRNTIWKRNGYCFTSAKAKQTLGNAGCSRDQAAARAAMSATDLAEVDALSAKEQGMGCQ